MGSLQIWQRNEQVSISLLFFLLSLFIFFHVISLVEGRGIERALMEGKKAEGKISSPEMMGSEIGSRPPICRRRCRQCGSHCEAVQVPVALHDSHDQNPRKRRSSHFSTAVLQKSKGSSKHDNVAKALTSEDETSNYKPISWKCKCGSFIFNP